MNFIVNTLILKFKNMPKLYNILFITLMYISFFMVYGILYVETSKETNVGIIYSSGKKSDKIIEFLEKHLDSNMVFYNDEDLLKNDVLNKKLNIGYVINSSIESKKSSSYKESIVIYKREDKAKNYIITEIIRASLAKLILNEIIVDTLKDKIKNKEDINIDKILTLTYLNTSLSNFEKNIYNINNSNNKSILYKEIKTQEILQMVISISSFIIILYNFSYLISKEESSILKLLSLKISSIKSYYFCNIVYISILSIILLILNYSLIMIFFNLDEYFTIKMFLLSFFYSFNIASLEQLIYLFSNNKFKFCFYSIIILFSNIIIGCKYINIPIISNYKILLQLVFPINNFIFNLDTMLKYVLISFFQNIFFLYIINKKINRDIFKI